VGYIYERGYPVGYHLVLTGITSTGIITTEELVRPFKDFSFQIYGIGAAATAWSVSLQGSPHTGNKFASLTTHQNTSHGNGDILVVSEMPLFRLRILVNSLTLGSATEINAEVLGMW